MAMAIERDAVHAAIESLERQRDVLGDDVVDQTVRPLRERLALLNAPPDSSGPITPPGPRFEDEPQLRQATILFVDTVGSTSMSGALDAEDIHELMNVLARRFTDVVERHHGRVMKYTGDGLLAAFGLADAQEHAAAEAIRAGLAMHRETASVAQTSSIELPDSGLQIRVGVHTGEALIGGGVEARSSIFGQAVNLAARPPSCWAQRAAPTMSCRMRACWPGGRCTRSIPNGRFEPGTSGSWPTRPTTIDADADDGPPSRSARTRQIVPSTRPTRRSPTPNDGPSSRQ
jgi:class 3 adenylate cyclase